MKPTDTNRTDVDRMVEMAGNALCRDRHRGLFTKGSAVETNETCMGCDKDARIILDAIDLAAILAAGEAMRMDIAGFAARETQKVAQAWLAATAKLREGTG